MQSLLNLGLYTYFTMNRKMIADKVCVNKSNPQLHCNGHCYLVKQLKKAEKNEKQQSQVLKEQDENVVSNEHSVVAVYFPSYQITLIYPQEASSYRFQYVSDTVEPPSV